MYPGEHQRRIDSEYLQHEKLLGRLADLYAEYGEPVQAVAVRTYANLSLEEWWARCAEQAEAIKEDDRESDRKIREALRVSFNSDDSFNDPRGACA